MKPKKIYKLKKRTNEKHLDYYIKNLRREDITQEIEEQNEINEAINNFMKDRRI